VGQKASRPKNTNNGEDSWSPLRVRVVKRGRADVPEAMGKQKMLGVFSGR